MYRNLGVAVKSILSDKWRTFWSVGIFLVLGLGPKTYVMCQMSSSNLDSPVPLKLISSTTIPLTDNFNNDSISVKCPLGYESKNKAHEEVVQCVKCSIGNFRNSTMEKCSICPAGHEATIEGMKECTPCYYGKYKHVGELKCHDCSSGTISLAKGSIECQKCPLNYYCPCSVCHPVQCSQRGFCPEGSEFPIFCKFPLTKRTIDGCEVTSELVGLICGAVLLVALLSSVLLANIFLKTRTDVILISTEDSGSSRYLLQDASSSSELRYSGL